MTSTGSPRIERFATGISGLDRILGGGFLKGSLNIITGGPGTGKSTLALQILAAHARRGEPVIYFPTISEPALKLLRYMLQFEFFDPGLIDGGLSICDLSGPALSRDLNAVFATVLRQVREKQAAGIAIDSFRPLREQFPDDAAARAFIYDLGIELTTAGITAFLVCEHNLQHIPDLPEFYAADGIVHLSTTLVGPRAARQLEVLKLRGSGYAPGVHFFDITAAGIAVYPRVTVPEERAEAPRAGRAPLLSTGVAGLDAMLGGGIPARSTTLLQGGSGTGKTLLAMTFLVEGARHGEPGLMFTLDETREQLLDTGAKRGWKLPELERQGLLRIAFNSPVELAGDALFQKMNAAVAELGAKRAAIDSLTTLEMSIAPQERSRELVYSIGKAFRMAGVTTFMTSEVPELVGTAHLTGLSHSSVADNIIVLRYVELESRLVPAISVLKVRGADHERVLRRLRIAKNKIEVADAFAEYRGVLTGVPSPIERRQDDA